MNFYLVIIVTALTVEFLVNRVTGMLNIRSLSSALPEEFKNIYDKEKYSKSQSYTRTNEKFDMAADTFSYVIIICMIIFGFFNIIDVWVRNFGFQSEVINGLLFFGLFILIQDIISSPFSLYKIFVIEEKYGFNKMSLSTYFLDKLKSLFLMVLLGGPMLSLILYFFETFDNTAWLYAWCIVSGFILILQPLFTTFIAPLFNTFTPLEEGELRSAIESYAKNVDFPISRIDVMDGSKRTSHSNAYFSGIGKRKRIALFDTLLEKQTSQEILAIVAHEVGHFKKKHIQQGILISILNSGIMFYLISVFMKNQILFEAFQMNQISVYGSLIFFQILFSPLSTIISVFANALSRRNEFEADEYSAKTTGEPENLISGLKKLTVENLGNLTPHPLNVFLNFSHPPVLERIRALSS
ncbi:MAG: peptidase M48 [Candidatus Marinimicrobia bacterium]|nr:peptidase M48 [Candidatus Neomarinimicrobiota bacterium]|tara:strand:- start:6157 stop:7389 length:1233 start_codon:yes stop_codon:yes gene_type:complete